MIVHLPKFVARYWIALVVCAFALLSGYTHSPLYGQSAEPTPDINTVPRPELIATPTNTPFPTPTPISNDPLPGGGVTDGGSGGIDTGDNDNNDNNDGDGNDTGGGNSVNNDAGGNAGGNAGGSSNREVDNNVENTLLDTGGALLTEDTPTGVINAVTLNIRRSPSLDAGIVDTIFLNEPVSILGRDSGGEWWYVCCGTGFGREGWVSAQFVTPNFTIAEAETLLPVTANSNASATADRDDTANSANTASDALILEMRPSPAFVWQGRKVQLQFVLRNQSEQSYTDVRLRNDLPPELLYIDGVVNNDGDLRTAGQAADGLIYTINWPEIPAGGQVSATITLQVAENLVNGILIDNLAAVDTAEGANALAGITFAMPPVPLPRFQR